MKCLLIAISISTLLGGCAKKDWTVTDIDTPVIGSNSGGLVPPITINWNRINVGRKLFAGFQNSSRDLANHMISNSSDKSCHAACLTTDLWFDEFIKNFVGLSEDDKAVLCRCISPMTYWTVEGGRVVPISIYDPHEITGASPVQQLEEYISLPEDTDGQSLWEIYQGNPCPAEQIGKDFRDSLQKKGLLLASN